LDGIICGWIAKNAYNKVYSSALSTIIFGVSLLPHFLDLFQEVLRTKLNSMQEKLNRQITPGLREAFLELFLEHWHPLPQPQELDSDFQVLAVDGSGGLRRYANGAFFYVARAYGVSSTGEHFRFLDADVFLARGSGEEVRKYLTLKSEYAEIQVALEGIRRLEGEQKYLLIDGSLYGRAMHLVKEAVAEGDRDFPLRYVDAYCTLMEECRKLGVIPIGLSKDSRTRFFRNKLIETVYLTELEQLRGLVSREDLKTLHSCLITLDETPSISLSDFLRLKAKYGSILDRIDELLFEYRREWTDFHFIMQNAQYPGYTTPMELGPVQRRARRRFDDVKNSPEEYLRRRFRNAIADSENPRRLLDYGVGVLRRLLNFPTIVSFHVLLSLQDTPLRIDVPCWALGIENTMGNLTECRFLDGEVDALSRVIGVLLAGYAGLRNYNVWLVAADERVRLTRQDMDQVYEGLLSRALGLTLIHSRRYRRVRYP